MTILSAKTCITYTLPVPDPLLVPALDNALTQFPPWLIDMVRHYIQPEPGNFRNHTSSTHTMFYSKSHSFPDPRLTLHLLRILNNACRNLQSILKGLIPVSPEPTLHSIREFKQITLIEDKFSAAETPSKTNATQFFSRIRTDESPDFLLPQENRAKLVYLYVGLRKFLEISRGQLALENKNTLEEMLAEIPDTIFNPDKMYDFKISLNAETYDIDPLFVLDHPITPAERTETETFQTTAVKTEITNLLSRIVNDSVKSARLLATEMQNQLAANIRKAQASKEDRPSQLERFLGRFIKR